MGMTQEFKRVTHMTERWNWTMENTPRRGCSRAEGSAPHIRWDCVPEVRETVLAMRDCDFINDYMVEGRYGIDHEFFAGLPDAADKYNWSTELTMEELMRIRDDCDDVIGSSRFINPGESLDGDELVMMEDASVAKALVPIKDGAHRHVYDVQYISVLRRVRDAIDMLAKEERKFKMSSDEFSAKFSVHYTYEAH